MYLNKRLSKSAYHVHGWFPFIRNYHAHMFKFHNGSAILCSRRAIRANRLYRDYSAEYIGEGIKFCSDTSNSTAWLPMYVCGTKRAPDAVYRCRRKVIGIIDCQRACCAEYIGREVVQRCPACVYRRGLVVWYPRKSV